MTTYTLEASGLDPLTFDTAEGWRVRQFDWVSGVVRAQSQDAPDSDGAIDTTRLRGAGTVTLGVRLIPGVESVQRRLDRLKSFTHLGLRPTLTVDYGDGSTPRVAVLSQGQVTSPHEKATHRDAAVVFKVPAGILESSELQVAVSQASGAAGALGRTYPLEFDRTYPVIDPSGSVRVTNDGNADAYPLIRLYGPWSGEASIINDLTGRALVFDGETVAAGNYLEIDTRARTILLNSEASQSRYHRLVFPDSKWWTLVPGEQRVRFVAETFTAPAQAQTWWRSAFL